MQADTTRLPDHWLAREINWRIAIASVLLLQSALVATHSHWLDEWQALQIAIDSPDWPALLRNLRYEGHPPLWYLLLRSIAHVSGPILALKIALLPIAIAGQLLILLKAPFARIDRIAISLSALTLFEYFTLSRSLSLGVLCLLLTVWQWHSRRAPWLSIAALPLCDFLFGVLSLLAVAARLRGAKIWWPGALLWLISGLFAAWAVRPAPDFVPALQADILSKAMFAMANIGTLLVPFQAQGITPVWNSALPMNLGIAFAPVFCWFCWHQLRDNFAKAVGFFSFLLITIFFSVFIYPLQFRHMSLIAMLLILLRWNMAEEQLLPNFAFRIWLLVCALCGLATAAYALSHDFDRAPAVAHYIKANELSEKRWLAYPAPFGQSVSALTGTEFERLDAGCRSTFIRWNQKTSIASPADLDRAIERVLSKGQRSYLLTAADFDRSSRKRPLRLLAHFPAGHDGQQYYLYVVGPDFPDGNWRAPRCTADTIYGNQAR